MFWFKWNAFVGSQRRLRSTGPAVGFIGAIAVRQDLWELGMLLVVVGIVSFLAGWFTLGVAAIGLDRKSSALRPA